MRLIAFLFLLALSSRSNAQIPALRAESSLANRFAGTDSLHTGKWSLSRYTAVSSSYLFFKGGNALQLSAPIGLQLTRQLSPHLYAFASASIAPTYTSFSHTFVVTEAAKSYAGNALQRGSYTGLYPSASLGLQYVNEERTFSISGSVRMERINYSLLPYPASFGAVPATTLHQRGQ